MSLHFPPDHPVEPGWPHLCLNGAAGAESGLAGTLDGNRYLSVP
jgi:hypothetical protein